MYKLIYFIFTIVIMLACSNSIINTNDNIIIQHDTIQIIDTIYIEHLDKVDALNDTIDSIKQVNDSLNSDLFVAKYRLNRIAYYNKIAANKNNIKYLRGWINRVLNEN